MTKKKCSTQTDLTLSMTEALGPRVGLSRIESEPKSTLFLLLYIDPEIYDIEYQVACHVVRDVT